VFHEQVVALEIPGAVITAPTSTNLLTATIGVF
jgi:hypothetical protein